MKAVSATVNYHHTSEEDETAMADECPLGSGAAGVADDDDDARRAGLAVPLVCRFAALPDGASLGAG